MILFTVAVSLSLRTALIMELDVFNNIGRNMVFNYVYKLIQLYTYTLMR